MFEAKSDLWNISTYDLIKYDYKEFELNGNKIWVWTIETTNPDYTLNRKDDILIEMQNIKKQDWLNFIILSVVDIIWEQNITITLDWIETTIIEEVFNTKVEFNQADLKKRLSRKKQILPDLTNYFLNK
jgi:manganese-dependent inorganic pyrophosphatase